MFTTRKPDRPVPAAASNSPILVSQVVLWQDPSSYPRRRPCVDDAGQRFQSWPSQRFRELPARIWRRRSWSRAPLTNPITPAAMTRSVPCVGKPDIPVHPKACRPPFTAPPLNDPRRGDEAGDQPLGHLRFGFVNRDSYRAGERVRQRESKIAPHGCRSHPLTLRAV
jgi:hypothetical protein